MAIQIALKNKSNESATILPANPEYLALSNNFGESNMQLTGSSPEMLVNLVNSRLLPKDARIATRKNLEKAIKKASDFLSRFYVNFGLNLDSRNTDYEINPAYAKALAKDLKAVGINLKDARLIPYDILTKQFKLSKKGKDTAKKLILNTYDFEWGHKPSTSGLFGAFLGGGWDCRGVGLLSSYSGGRVVVISGEATSRKFLDVYASKLKENRDEAIASVQKEYTERESSLRVG